MMSPMMLGRTLSPGLWGLNWPGLGVQVSQGYTTKKITRYLLRVFGEVDG